ncbi:toll-like receptor 2 [Sceloporus undulatus]|uniref:toll-like receptor 2 n=1 Tax=Sceloporus undulatus TaxID=8520 RepID=UPI001C4B8E0E|nr:toll-like receptor 2 [Sceloporus undulatus]
MEIFLRTLYFSLIILSCDGEGEFHNPKTYLSSPSSDHTLNHSSEPDQSTLRPSSHFLKNDVENMTRRMTEHSSTLENSSLQQNQSSKLDSVSTLSNRLAKEPSLQTFSEVKVDSSKDHSLQGAIMSPEPAKENLHEHPMSKWKAVGHERYNDTSLPSIAMMATGCAIPVNGALDLSNRNLSENELRRKMDSRPCQVTLDKIEEFNASYNNLEMDLTTLISLLLKMKNVHAIDLSCNKITANSICVKEMYRLENSTLLFLNLSHNPLKTLKNLCLPPSLKSIDLSFTQINEIPQWFATTFAYIEEMYVQGNRFIYNAASLGSVKLKFPNFHHSAVSYIDFPKRTPIESLPKDVKHLVMSNCSIVELPEWFAKKMERLLLLDLSNNPMNTFPNLPTSLQCLDLSNGNIESMTSLNFFSNLTVVKIQNNKIEDISPRHLPKSLEEFDISKNKIRQFPFLGTHQKLEALNISGNFIMQLNFSTIYSSLSNLDASHNLITELYDQTGKFLPELKCLNLSGNKISFLQPGSLPESLLELDISNNAITIIMKETFGRLINLKVLSVQGKHFFCNCDLYWFANTYLASPAIQIHGQNALKCSFPPSKRGILVENSNLTILHCSVGLQMGITACMAILVMSITTALCWRFHGPWYIKMGWYWCMAKRKQYEEAEDKLYDAFVSYSENDAPWTKEVLLENLETNGFKVCYHERDFMPGHPVLGNIFYCIENSHKVLFVLSPSFVNSCWCQYELYFAEHRVLNENQDSLIMVVLEDLPPNSIPQRFSKLRKLLKKKTYLKWSPEEHKQKLFWCQLKAVLRTTNEPVVRTKDNEMQQPMDGMHLRLKLHEQGV